MIDAPVRPVSGYSGKLVPTSSNVLFAKYGQVESVAGLIRINRCHLERKLSFAKKVHGVHIFAVWVVGILFFNERQVRE